MATVPVSEVKSTHDRSARTAAHSHIKGLGLAADGRATNSAGGFVGQAAAREVRLDTRHSPAHPVYMANC